MIIVMLLAAFIITPLGFSFLLLMIFRKPSLQYKYVSFIGLLFGMIGYCTDPLRTIDISRYFEQIDGIRGLPVTSALNWMDDGLVIKNAIFWLISRTNDNHLLPFFSMLTIYSVLAYLVADVLSTSGKASLFGKCLIMQIMLIPFYNVFSNVRNVTAFALLELAVYRDIYKGKRDIWTLLLYIVPCYIHMAGIVIVVMRILLPFIRRISYLGRLLLLGIPTAVITFYPRMRSIRIPGNIGKVITRAIWKAYASVVKTSQYAQEVQTHGSFVVNRILAAAFCIILLYLINRYQSLYKDKDNKKYNYAIYVEITAIIGLMFTVLGVVKYWVFMYLVYLSYIPVLAEYLQTGKKKIGKTYLCVIALHLIALLRAMLQIRTIILNLDINSFMLKILFTDYIMVGFSIMKGVLSIR